MCKGFFNGPLAKFIPVKQVVFAEPLAKSLRGEPMAQRYIGCNWHLQSVFSRLLPWSTTVAGLVRLNTSPHT